jgi:hypothetical protein
LNLHETKDWVDYINAKKSKIKNYLLLQMEVCLAFYDYENDIIEKCELEFLDSRKIVDWEIIDWNLLAFACSDGVIFIFNTEEKVIVKSVPRYEKLELLGIKSLRQNFSAQHSELLVCVYGNGDKICWNLEAEKIAFKFTPIKVSIFCKRIQIKSKADIRIQEGSHRNLAGGKNSTQRISKISSTTVTCTYLRLSMKISLVFGLATTG